MEKLKTNQRKIHRKITAISAIPLLITIVSGTIYSIIQPLGIDAFWLIKWHTGNFGIINLQPFYSIFLGIASILSIISGVKLLQKKSSIYSKPSQNLTNLYYLRLHLLRKLSLLVPLLLHPCKGIS